MPLQATRATTCPSRSVIPSTSSELRPVTAGLRTALICQADDPLNRDGLARWLASFSDLAGVVVLDETRQRAWRRVRREIRYFGRWRFLDVLAFRLYYRLALRGGYRRWEEAAVAYLTHRFPPLTSETRILRAASPNTAEVGAFLGECRPDLVIARCKWILKPEISRSRPRARSSCTRVSVHSIETRHGCFCARPG